MKIRFGLHLDGQRCTAPANCLGEIVVGPLGFLTILETQLGLLAERPSHAERIVQYRDCLAQADTAERFYHASFATDALGTAETLLGWRDLWHLHGWNGQIAAGAGLRLGDLAAVEALARAKVAPSPGERLARVVSELERRRPSIAKVSLADPIEAFPARWQTVLGRLSVAHGCAEPVAGKGFLGRLQERLSRATTGRTFDRLPWQEDGTVRAVRGETRALAADWLASRLDPHTPALLVSGGEGARLDAHLARADRPRHGFRETSAFRPALQVLPLALEILWEPVNFYGLVQFLTHPICPLPRHARWQLAAKVSDAPGIGGEAWERVLGDIGRHYGEKAAAVREEIRRWVEHPRFRQEVGAPIAVVLERVKALTQFFRVRLGDEDRARQTSFAAGHAQCHASLAALTALQAQGVESVRPRQLQKLVAHATNDGTDNPLWAAEVGAHLAISHPGAAIERTDEVVWWQLSMPALPAAYPWSAAERHALAAAGVALRDTGERLAQAAREWLRPILAARRRLTLVLPSEGEEAHPVWQMIEAITDRPIVRPLERLLSEGDAAMTPVTHAPLPVRKRWWRLPTELTVALRQKESFSSLELMLFNPYHWLLKYGAALRPSRIMGLGGDFRILGNLAHALVESYYRRPDALQMSDAQFSAWFAPAFDRLVAEEGAMLLMPGRGADLESFRHRLLQSMKSLRQQIARGAVVEVVPEMALSGTFPGGELSGFADLVARKGSGEHAIVDMKWSGAKKFPDKLRQNRHLQLAIYAELLRQTNGAWPAVAYYVLDRARFFAPDDRAFPDAEVVASASGENTAQLWQRFLTTWRWRKDQFESGAFEVVLEGIEPTDESVPPEEAMSMETLNESYNDYLALAGWEA